MIKNADKKKLKKPVVLKLKARAAEALEGYLGEEPGTVVRTGLGIDFVFDGSDDFVQFDERIKHAGSIASSTNTSYDEIGQGSTKVLSRLLNCLAANY